MKRLLSMGLVAFGFLASNPGFASGPIDWKVGDTANYAISIGSLSKVGTMLKSVTKDNGDTLWTREDYNEMGQRQVFDRLFNKADGKLLKLILNGKEQKLDDGHPQVISSEETELTVPAGHFKCVHDIIQVDGLKPYATWTDTSENSIMGGMIKQAQPADSPLGVVLELVSWKHAE